MDYFFLFKKIVNALASPVAVALVLLAAGFLLAAARKRRAGWWLAGAGFLALALFSFAFLPNRLVTPLEYRHPPLLETADLPEVGWVVVLAGGHRPDEALPLTSRLVESTLVRLVEGIRLHREIPGSGLLLSGGGVFHDQTSAELMAELAAALGVDPGAIRLEKESRDTASQAEILKDILGEEPFVLVTSASHMPRSVFLFQNRGMNPIPAPAGHLTSSEGGWDLFSLFPSSGHLRKAETAFRERLGLLWETLAGER